MFTIEQTRAPSKKAKDCCLGESRPAAEDDSRTFCVACERADKVKAERVSTSWGIEQAKAERDSLAARIRELEAAAATQYGEVGVRVQAVLSLKGRIASGEDRANTEEVPACETLEKMSELRALLEGLSTNVGSECARVVGLGDAELVHVRLGITAALSERGATVSEGICKVPDSFPVKAAYDAAGLSAEGSSDQA